jgi:hypothetical protein
LNDLSTVAAPQTSESVWEWLDEEDETDGAQPTRSPLERVRAAEEPSSSEREMFEILAGELEDAAAGLASPRKAMRHPAYTEILALGFEAVPWIMSRIETARNRPLWMRVLGSLTGLPPGRGAETVVDAAQAWLAWGHHGVRFVGRR